MALNSPPLELFDYKNHNTSFLKDTESSESFDTYSTMFPTLLSNPIHSSLNAGMNYAYSSSSVLSFNQVDRSFPLPSYYSSNEQEEECDLSIDDITDRYQTFFDGANVCNSTRKGAIRDNEYMNMNSIDTIQEIVKQDKASQKRPYEEAEMNMDKKQCGINKKTKAKTSISTIITTKDPQSIAAKNRRERISERLKVLQELVPNGTKVDLVTMLEKAISYVKFLQLQVKVLATDEFWPSQGGKTPNISQAKEALHAILSSQRNQNSS